MDVLNTINYWHSNGLCTFTLDLMTGRLAPRLWFRRITYLLFPSIKGWNRNSLYSQLEESGCKLYHDPHRQDYVYIVFPNASKDVFKVLYESYLYPIH